MHIRTPYMYIYSAQRYVFDYKETTNDSCTSKSTSDVLPALISLLKLQRLAFGLGVYVSSVNLLVMDTNKRTVLSNIKRDEHDFGINFSLVNPPEVFNIISLIQIFTKFLFRTFQALMECIDGNGIYFETLVVFHQQ